MCEYLEIPTPPIVDHCRAASTSHLTVIPLRRQHQLVGARLGLLPPQQAAHDPAGQFRGAAVRDALFDNIQLLVVTLSSVV